MTFHALEIPIQPQSYSNYSNSYGAALLSAAIFGQQIPAPEPQQLFNIAQQVTYSSGPIGQAYQALEIWQSGENYELFNTLRGLYENLAQRQTDLGSDIKKILYSNLWDLYE